jgi:hypothetical protein
MFIDCSIATMDTRESNDQIKRKEGRLFQSPFGLAEQYLPAVVGRCHSVAMHKIFASQLGSARLHHRLLAQCSTDFSKQR